MKKAFLILGLVAVSAAAGGATAWTLAAGQEPSVEYIEREVERTPALGTHFTSYEAGQYPDLTYAAENAVKAVVNIEAVQQIEMPRRGAYGYDYDPFLEFFGIPQEYGRRGGSGELEYQERRAGGSGVIEEVLSGPANDVWVVRGELGELLLPVVDQVVSSVPDDGPIEVCAPAGLTWEVR